MLGMNPAASCLTLFPFLLANSMNQHIPRMQIGSLRSHYGDVEDNVDQKNDLYFTYGSRDTLKSFTLFITVKTIRKINLKHSAAGSLRGVELYKRYFLLFFFFIVKKLADVVHVLQTTQNLVTSSCPFAKDGGEMYKELKRTCTAIVLLIKPFV